MDSFKRFIGRITSFIDRNGKLFFVLHSILLTVGLTVLIIALATGNPEGGSGGSHGGSADVDSSFSGWDSDNSTGFDEEQLYREYIADTAEKLGYAELKSYTESYSWFRDWTPPYSGIVSAYIADLNGDDVSEMIMTTTNSGHILVEMYRAENGEIAPVEVLFDDVRMRCEEYFFLYVKHHEGKNYIVLDYAYYPYGTGSSTLGNNCCVYEYISDGWLEQHMDYSFQHGTFGRMTYRNFDEELLHYDGETDTYSGKFNNTEALYDYLDEMFTQFGLKMHAELSDIENAPDTDAIFMISWQYGEGDILTCSFADYTNVRQTGSGQQNGNVIGGEKEYNNAPQTAQINSGNIRWLLEPSVKADDINVLRCSRHDEINGITDFNSMGKHKYDLVSLYSRNGKLGLISYSGGEVVGSEYEEITVGHGQSYLLERYNDDNGYIVKTLSDLYEQIDVNDPYDITGTAENDIPVWSNRYGLCSRMTGARVQTDSGLNRFVAAQKLPDDAIQEVDGRLRIDLNYSEGIVLVRDGELINDVVYEDAGSYSCGIIPVRINGKWGYVDESGRQVLPFEFDSGWQQYYGETVATPDAYNASGGYVVVSKNNQYALYDTSGRLIIDFGTFECIRPVYEGMCWVKHNGLWGVIAVEDDVRLESYAEPDEYISGTEKKVSSSNGLRMRFGPGTHYRVVSILSNHAKVTVFGRTDDGVWSLVEFGNVCGWVKTEYLK